MLVTDSSGVSVMSLDDRPALDVYLETLKAPPEASASPEAFAAFAATHPLGIPRRDRIEIRYVAGADLETRSLTCIAGLPQGGMTMFMQGDSESVLGATENACREACDGLTGAAPIGSSTAWRAARCWRAPQTTENSSAYRSCWAPCPWPASTPMAKLPAPRVQVDSTTRPC